MKASWKPENIKRRIYRARNFPVNTCPCSRHVELMAENLLKYGKDYIIEEEPEHAAQSMLITVELLYKAKNKLKKLGF